MFDQGVLDACLFFFLWEVFVGVLFALVSNYISTQVWHECCQNLVCWVDSISFEVLHLTIMHGPIGDIYIHFRTHVP